ncbi:MAG: AAA family ATPase, partial [Tannerella sp.]|nr:AAA family ATPase [Tannerella sp.]
MALRNLPIGVQSFEKMRKDDYVYVDKTEAIYRIVTGGNIYFLSRPRRFGKSLTVSTLEELFKGNKALFEGLYIHDKWDWTKHYPVIRIDW